LKNRVAEIFNFGKFLDAGFLPSIEMTSTEGRSLAELYR